MPHTYIRTTGGGSNGTTLRRAVSYRRITTSAPYSGQVRAEARHVEDAAREVGVDLRGEERHRGHDRRGLAPSGPVVIFAVLARRVLGPHRARPQRVDGDAERPEFGRDRARVALERGLGDDVEEVAGRHERLGRVRGAARRDVHDAAAAGAGHRRHDGPGEQVEAAHVDAHRLVPLFDGRVGEQRLRRRHRVVDKRVDAAELARRSCRRAA